MQHVETKEENNERPTPRNAGPRTSHSKNKLDRDGHPYKKRFGLFGAALLRGKTNEKGQKESRDKRTKGKGQKKDKRDKRGRKGQKGSEPKYLDTELRV